MRQPVHVDKALAKRILRGDEEAFRRLFDDFFPKLYRFAMARLDGDHAAARDIVQETFCKAIERLDSYRDMPSCTFCPHRSLLKWRRAVAVPQGQLIVGIDKCCGVACLRYSWVYRFRCTPLRRRLIRTKPSFR